jgi:hypothetical protein
MVDIFRVLSVQNPNMNLVLTTNSDLLRRHLIQKYALLSDQALTVITMTGNPHQGVDVTVSSTGRRPHFPDNRLPAPLVRGFSPERTGLSATTRVVGRFSSLAVM